MTVQHDHVHHSDFEVSALPHSDFAVSALPLFFAAAFVLLVCAWSFVP